MRVKALEAKFDKIDAKLDAIGHDLAYVKGRVEGMPTALSFGELKGRVDSLPTMAKVGTLVAIVGGLLAIALRWPEVSAFIAGS